MISYSKLKRVGFATALVCLSATSLYAKDNVADYQFTTLLPASELETGAVTIKPVFNSQTDLIFYSKHDKAEATYSTGFFKLNQDNSVWQQFQLPILSTYEDSTIHNILDATDGPYNNTLVLSHVVKDNKNITYLSNTGDGGLWYTQQVLSDKFYTDIASTKVYDHKNFVVYGKGHDSALVSMDGSIWGHYLLPDTCFDTEDCSTTNKHISSVYNGYLLLQSTYKPVADDTNSDDNTDSESDSDSGESELKAHDTSFVTENRLLFSQDLYSWYDVELPFKSSQVQKVFKTHLNGFMASVKCTETGEHKFWFTKDYKKWQSFDLSNDAVVLDAKTGYENYITISLGHDNKSDIVILDPEANTQEIFTTFEGTVTGMNWHNDSLYISGNFVNFEDVGRAYLVNMKRKVTDDTEESDDSSEESDSTDGESDSGESEVSIDVSTLRFIR